ncbi:MAG: DUF1150 family protein [Tropicimonas sp.]|uniref:DUF1150 family protein n=1 Tax=Tropicimonas sp. TaxID=2067044 RepID=UPI003A842FD6
MDYRLPFDDDAGTVRPIVYVRPAALDDLPQELRGEAIGVAGLYSVHDEDGQRLALVRGRKLAFFLARQNDMAPVNVH